jgi:hypothetical protein
MPNLSGAVMECACPISLQQFLLTEVPVEKPADFQNGHNTLLISKNKYHLNLDMKSVVLEILSSIACLI